MRGIDGTHYYYCVCLCVWLCLCLLLLLLLLLLGPHESDRLEMKHLNSPSDGVIHLGNGLEPFGVLLTVRVFLSTAAKLAFFSRWILLFLLLH